MKNNIFKRCPKSKRIVGINMKSRWYRILFPLLGLAALVWFLIRVIPKPSRISYPCQRAALPIAIGFLGVLGGITGVTGFYRIIKSKPPLKTAVKSAASLLVLCLTVFLIVPIVVTGCNDTANLSVATLPSTEPQTQYITTMNGTDEIIQPRILPRTREIESLEDILEFYLIPADGIGIFPGRVVYAHNPGAVRFNGSGFWWEDANTVPEEVQRMFIESLHALTGKDNSADAWDALFRNFNSHFNNEDAPYQRGEKIVIKLNMNQDNGGRTGNIHIPAPQLVAALVSELIHTVGADPSDITLTDPSRSIGDAIYNYFIENADPAMRNVRFVAQNRIRPVADRDEPLYFADGQIGYVSTDYTAARYLINLAVFRPHDMFGITFTGKNHYGSVQFGSGSSFNPSSIHSSWNNGYGQYSHITDLLAFRHLGGKTLLNIIDGLYASYHQGDGNVRRMQSFGGEYPASLFMSQDPVAIDSVAYDFLDMELRINSRFRGRMPGNAFDNYLIEAAYADMPPSNTDYDPNRTGVRVSLGAWERWNNDTDRQYSRNLGKNYGIELIQLFLN